MEATTAGTFFLRVDKLAQNVPAFFIDARTMETAMYA
jgi:hypothetical protein